MNKPRQSWFVWGLPLLLAASMLAGMAIDRSQDVKPETGAAAQPKDEANQLPRFDCEDRSRGPYEADPATQQKHLDWLSENLDLEAQQLAAVREVFDASAIQADAFWRRTRDEYCALRDQMRSNVRAELSEEQNRRLDRLLAEYRAKKVSDPATEPEKSP